MPPSYAAQLEYRNGSAYLDEVNWLDRQGAVEKIKQYDGESIEMKLDLWKQFLALYRSSKEEQLLIWKDLDKLEEIETRVKAESKIMRLMWSDDRSVQFYKKFLEFKLRNVNQSEIEFIPNLFDAALRDTEFDFNSSHIISSLYINFLLDTNQREALENHFLRRLTIPHKEIQATFEKYYEVLKQISGPAGLNENAINDASRLCDRTSRSQYDLERAHVRNPGEEADVYWNKLLDYVTSVPKKQRNVYKVIPIFEQAIQEINDISIWERFISILYEYDAGTLIIENYLTRFVKAFPDSQYPYIEIMRNLNDFEDNAKTYPLLKERIDHLIKLNKVDHEGWKNLTISTIMYLLTQIKNGEDFKQLFDIEAKRAFEEALSRDDNTFHSVERAIAAAYEEIDDFGTARSYYRQINRAYPTEAEGWLIAYNYERRVGEYEDALKILKAAINVSENLDWPERIFEEALRYVEIHGDSTGYRLLKTKIDKKMKEVEQVRLSRLEADNLSEMEEDDLEVENSGKRRAPYDSDSNEGEDGTKKQKTDNHRDRENLTVAVRNIPKKVSEKQIRNLFKDCGEIKEMHIVSVGNLQQANIEFSNEKDFARALTRDYKKLGGKEVHVQKLANSTVWATNFPPSFSKENLENLFAKYGTIASIRLPSLKFNSQRRFCYVEYTSAEDSKTAVQEVDGQTIDGFKLSVKISDPSSKQNRTGAAEEGREVYVSKLDFYKVTASKVKELFSKYGEVENVHLPLSDRNKAQGKKHDGYGFVTFSKPEEAQESLKLNLVSFEGRVIEVSISESKAQRAHKKEVQALKDYSRSEKAIALKNLPDTINAERLKQYFNKIGEVADVVLEPEFNGAIVEFTDNVVGKVSLVAEGQNIDDYTIQITTVSDLKRVGGSTAARAPRKVGLVPSSLRRQVAGLDISSVKKVTSNDTTPDEPTGTGETSTTTKPKSNADFRRMFLGGN